MLINTTPKLLDVRLLNESKYILWICVLTLTTLIIILYNLQHMLAKLLIEVLCLGKDSADSNRLLNFKAPKAAKGVFIYFNSKYRIL